MLVRVDIEHLVIVDRAQFEPGPGLTAITGETGAGKTLLATAIDLLFGGDANAGHVGPGAKQAWVEGEFEVDEAFWSHPDVAALAAVRPDEETPLILARRVEANGRSRALAWGRTVAKGDLAAAGKLLMATAGQHVQVRLRSAEYQRQTLDAAAGTHMQTLLSEMSAAWQAVVAARSERDRVVELAQRGDARLLQLQDDIARIDAVGATAEDEHELRTARDRARHHAALVDALATTSNALTGGDDGTGGAIDIAGRAYSTIEGAASLDAEFAELAESLLATQQQLSEIASEIGSRLSEFAEGPRSIDEIEERLAAYDDLHRRFGGTTEAVLIAREAMGEELATIEDASAALESAEAAITHAETAARQVAERISALRCTTADVLAADVADSLRELGMGGSVFRVQVEEGELGASGADRVSLMLAPSAEIEPQPVAKVASGGELSRIALALLVATTHERDGDDAPGTIGTILFDEIDAGIGGHTAHAVARLLRRLADRRQVLCITHLPQVAARADSHVVIEKAAGKDAAVRTTLHALDGERAVELELQRMLGAAVDDDAALTHVRQLRGTRFDLTGSDADAAPAPAPAPAAKVRQRVK